VYRHPVSLLGMAVAGFAAVTAAPAAAPNLVMLDDLVPGRWEIRSRDMGQLQRICVRDGRELLQLRHSGRTCKRFVVEDKANRVTVTYNCAAAGNGRTTLRQESSKLVQISTQGVDGGSPFAIEAEARYIGGC
jgi:predicted metalloprotease with PDZ domain